MRFGLVVFLVGMVFTCQSQGTLSIRFSQPLYATGDTLLFEAGYKSQTKIPKYATLHLTIQSAKGNKQWQLRYPMVNGIATAAIAIPDSLDKGVYFFNYRLQREMVHVMGRLKNEKPEKELTLMAKAQNKEVITQNVVVDEDGYFQIPNLLFEGKANFIFSPVKKYPVNFLEVEIETPVDSVFSPMAEMMHKIAVGVPVGDTVFHKADTGIRLSSAENELQNVTVTAKKISLIEQYQKAHVRGLFEGGNYILFDGLEEYDMTSYQSALNFLTGQVMGLSIGPNGESAMWRGFEPVYFVDEVETDIIGIQNVNTSDIAMIKVFRPPFYGVSMGSAGGAIAVYTKRGNEVSKYGPRNKFVINGYTPQFYKLVN